MTKSRASIHEWWDLGFCLVGRITDHPFQDRFHSSKQATSNIVNRPDELTEGSEVETLNTIYTLGKQEEQVSE